MRKIIKSPPPKSFLDWVRVKPNDKDENQWFSTLYHEKRYEILDDLKKHNTREQFYLCAYCCTRIDGKEDTRNEHVEARDIAPNRSLDYTNIVASCKTKKQCDSSHDNQSLPLTPLMNECESELKFNISGRVEGTSERAKESIRVLNLGDTEHSNKALIEKRKQLSHNLLWTCGIDPAQGLEDDDLLHVVIKDLLTPQNGILEPFAPVVANILSNWLSVNSTK